MLTSVKKEVANANNKLAILANSGSDKLKINAESYLNETVTFANKANNTINEIFKTGIQ